MALAAPLTAGCHALFIRPRLVGETRVESPSFVLRTDLGAESQRILIAAAEEMRGELEAAFPARPAAAGGAGSGAAGVAEPRREIVAFASSGGFRSYLGAHFFAKARAVGFYCDLGGECALSWREPPGPEDIRVLRHELVHQHLAVRMPGRIPAWVEEGLAEDLSLARTPIEPGWALYRERRFAADAIFAALCLHGGRESWPDAAERPASDVPAPAWADGEQGYVLHLLFVRFLESIGEGRMPGGALARMLDAAARGADAPLDLGARFATVGALEAAFDGFVVAEGLRALLADGPQALALSKLAPTRVDEGPAGAVVPLPVAAPGR